MAAMEYGPMVGGNENRPAAMLRGATSRERRERLARALSEGSDAVHIRADGTRDRIASAPLSLQTRSLARTARKPDLDTYRARAYALRLKGKAS
jgi:hypothetical protein